MNFTSPAMVAPVGRSLPALGVGEVYYHASFEMIGEDRFVEGVIAADGGSSAVSLLLHEEARTRGRSYSDVLPLACHALARRLSQEEAIILLPKVQHAVSMWKHSSGAMLETAPIGQSEFVLA